MRAHLCSYSDCSSAQSCKPCKAPEDLHITLLRLRCCLVAGPLHSGAAHWGCVLMLRAGYAHRCCCCKGSPQALAAPREPGAVEAAAASSVCDHHGAHFAVVKAAVHLLLHAQRALVPKRAQRQEDEATVRDHSNPALRPEQAHYAFSDPIRLLKDDMPQGCKGLETHYGQQSHGGLALIESL